MTFERPCAVIRALGMLGSLAIGLVAQGAPPAPHPDDALVQPPRLSFGPISGLTTRWHAAPAELPVPAGLAVYFVATKAVQGDVSWTNAVEFYESSEISIAVSPGAGAGETLVRASLRSDEGEVASTECLVRCLDVALDDIEISAPVLTVETLPEEMSNDATVAAFFGDSVAELGEGNKGSLVTSVDNVIAATVSVTPAVFAPVVEWRVDGVGTALGTTTRFRFTDPGERSIEAGRPEVGTPIVLTSYRVVILMPGPDDPLPSNGPITGIAITEPAGFEDRITWLAASKFGDTSPRTGRGPVFTAEFSDIFGENPHNPMGLWAWWGLKADNAKRGQDEKLIGCGTGDFLGFRDWVGRPRFSPPPNGANAFFPIPGGSAGSNEEPCPFGGPQGGGITNETYPVEGANLTEVSEAIFGAGGAGPMEGGVRFGGSATLQVNFRWRACGRDGNGDIQVELTDVTWTTIVLLPTWTPPAGASPQCIQEWNRFRAALAAHEAGHAAINDARMPAVRAAFVGAVPPRKISVPGQGRFPRYDAEGNPASAADAAIANALNAAVHQAIGGSAAMAALNQAQQNYDAPQTPANPTGTDHGATQGATLDTSILCWALPVRWRVYAGVRMAA